MLSWWNPFILQMLVCVECGVQVTSIYSTYGKDNIVLDKCVILVALYASFIVRNRAVNTPTSM